METLSIFISRTSSTYETNNDTDAYLNLRTIQNRLYNVIKSKN